MTAWEPDGASAAHLGEFDFEPAREVADAVLYEGYVLYPYRASAKKNHVRWQFGVLVPPAYAEAEPDEASWTQTECIVEPGDDAVLHARVRFLQLQAKRVEVRDGPGSDAFHVVDSLEAGGELHVTWDEAVDRDIDASVRMSELWGGGERAIPFDVPGGLEAQDLPPVDGSPARVARERWPLRGSLLVGLQDLDSPYGIARLRVRIRNETPFDGTGGRDGALRGSLLSAHLLLGLHGGSFVSSLDPPEWSKPYVEACTNVDAFPVLVGPDHRSDLMLSSRIVLYDRPQIAPESPGDLFDATEIDEILSLRTMALTEAEKREARATDPRAAEIIDRVDAMPQELLDRLHGAVRSVRESGAGKAATPWEAEIEPDTAGPRPAVPADPSAVPAWQEGVPWWDPGRDASVSPETDHVDVNGARVSRGSVVRLRPGVRRADAHDLFLQGRLAHVEAVLFDVDGSAHLAVTLQDDEAADLMQMHGRFLYFAPDEVEPVPDTDVDTARLEATTGTPVKALVAGVGNIFLTDDGFGAEVARRLAAEPLPDGVLVEDFGIRGVHLAYELMGGYDLAILIDTAQRGGPPGTLYVIEPSIEGADGVTAARQDAGGLPAAPLIDAHGMEPGAVLSLLRTLGGDGVRLLVVGCEPASLDEGMGLTDTVEGAVPEAIRLVKEVLDRELARDRADAGARTGPRGT